MAVNSRAFGTPASTSTSTGRRTVLKAAWAAPAITAIAAAPAFAASGTRALSIGSMSATVADYVVGSTTYDNGRINITVGNISMSGSGTITGMSMVVFVPAFQRTSDSSWVYPTRINNSTGTGWTTTGQGSQVTTGTLGTNFTFTASSGLAGGATYPYSLTFGVVFNLGGNDGYGNIGTGNNRTVIATLSSTGAVTATGTSRSAVVTASGSGRAASGAAKTRIA